MEHLFQYKLSVLFCIMQTIRAFSLYITIYNLCFKVNSKGVLQYRIIGAQGFKTIDLSAPYQQAIDSPHRIINVSIWQKYRKPILLQIQE